MRFCTSSGHRLGHCARGPGAAPAKPAAHLPSTRCVIHATWNGRDQASEFSPQGIQHRPVQAQMRHQLLSRQPRSRTIPPNFFPTGLAWLTAAGGCVVNLERQGSRPKGSPNVHVNLRRHDPDQEGFYRTLR